jgi:DnaJ-class molecular chaperone
MNYLTRLRMWFMADPRCSDCHGRGWFACPWCRGLDKKCPQCEGKGTIECLSCED